jgi:hypothetical protein
MALDTEDKVYIDSVINESMERNRIQFKGEMEVFFREQSHEHKRHMDELKTDLKKENEQTMGELVELVRDDIKKGIEIISSRPDREEVREIAREEARYLIRDDFNRYIVPNIKEAVESGIAPLRDDIRSLKDEVVALRKDSNRHDREIKALKLKAA